MEVTFSNLSDRDKIKTKMVFRQLSWHPSMLLTFVLYSAAFVFSEDAELSRLLGNYERRAQGILESRLNLAKTLDQHILNGNNHRTKRELPETLTTISDDLYVLENVTALTNNLVISQPQQLSVFCGDDGGFYIVVAGIDVSNLVTKVFKHNESAGTFDEVQSINTPFLTDLATFTMADGGAYLVLTEITSCRFVSTCTAVYKFDSVIQEFHVVQEIPSSGAIALETFELDDIWCLIIVNSQPRVNSTDDGVVYEWRGFYFDEICEFPVNQYTVDVCSFTIHNLKFVAIASNQVFIRRVSQIMVYSPVVDDFVHFQYIYVQGAVDFEFFTFGEGIEQEFFLALAVNRLSTDDEKSIIYKYHKGQFQIFQYIEANQAEKWHTITTPNGRFQLLVLSSSTAARFFFYDGWSFREIINQPSWATLPAGIRDFSSHTINNTVYLSIARFQTNTNDANVYMMEFRLENPVQELHDRALEVIELASQLVNESDALIYEVESEIDNLVSLDSSEEQVIASFKVFNAGVNDIGFLNASVLHGKTGSIFSEDEERIVEELSQNTTQRWPEIEEILELVPTFLRLSGDDQTVTGLKEFQEISADDVISSNISLLSNFINYHIDITEVKMNVVQTDQQLVIEVPLTILGEFNVRKNLDIDGLIDGINVDHLVLNNEDAVVDGVKIFKNDLDIVGDLAAYGTVDGVLISDDDILLNKGEQYYTGHLFIDGDVLFADDVHVETLNGIDLYELEENAVYKGFLNTTCIFTGYKEFLGEAVAGSHVSIWGNHTIDGVNIAEFEASTMQPDIEYSILGPLNVSGDVTIEGDLYVNGTVDDILIPEDVVFLNSSLPQVLEGKLNFTSDVVVDVIHALKNIDGIRSNLGEGGNGLDILLITGDQTFSGDLEFENDVHIIGGIVVGNTLGGVDVDFLYEVVTKDDFQSIYGEKTFTNDVKIEGDLYAGLINDVDIEQLNDLALRADDEVIATLGHITFLGPIEILGDLTTSDLHQFNGKTLDDFVLLDEIRVINGQKTFSDITSTDDVIVDGLINGIDLSELYEDAVIMNPSGTVYINGDIIFTDTVDVEGNITAPAKINDVLLSDIVTTRGPHEIISNVTFIGNQTAFNLEIFEDLFVEGLVDGADIDDLDVNTLKVNGNQYVYADKRFVQNLTVFGNLNVDGHIDNIDLEALADDAVYKTGSHNITAVKTFQNLVNFQSIWLSGLLDGVDLEKLKESAVLQDTKQYLGLPDIAFTGDVFIGNDLEVDGLVNLLDLQYLNSFSLRITDTTVSVEVNFEHLDVVSCDIIVYGLVDGIDLSQDAILMDLPGQVIHGPKTFINSVIVEGDIDGIDVINNINLTELYRTTVMNNTDQVITAPKHILGNMLVHDDMTVDGYFNWYEIDYLDQYVLQSDDAFVIFNANVTVDTLVVDDDIAIEAGLLCGMNLTDFRQSYLSKTLPQTITASSIYFANLEVNDEQFLSNNIVVLDYFGVIGHYVNDIDLSFMMILISEGREYQMINGTVSFMVGFTTDDITVLGTVNELYIPEDVMLISADNVVTASKRFTDVVTVDNNLNMDAYMTIDGTDISDWASTVTLTSDSLVMVVPANFNEDVVFLQDLIANSALIDGIDLSPASVLFTQFPQAIYGKKTFTDVAIKYVALYGKLNGYNVNEVYGDTLYDLGYQTMYGSHYSGEPAFTNITLYGLINDVDLLNMLQNLEHMVELDDFKESIEDRCESIDELHEAQENRAVLIGCTEIHTRISTVGSVSWDSYVFDDEQFLLVGTAGNGSSTCNPSYLYYWNQTSNDYELDFEFYPSRVDDISAVVFQGLVFIVIASQGDNLADCELEDHDSSINSPSAPGSVSVLIPTEDGVQHFQKIDMDNPEDIEVFENREANVICMTLVEAAVITDSSYTTNTLAHVYCRVMMGFIEMTTIPTRGAVKVTHFYVDGQLHLAIANFLDSSIPSVSTTSEVWMQTGSFTFTKAAEVASTAAMDILAMEINGNHYIVIANGFEGTLTDLDFHVPVQIYRYSLESGSGSLQWMQDLTAYGALQVDSYSARNKHLLFVVDRTETITVYKYQGTLLMFVRVRILPLEGAQSLYVFPVHNTNYIHAGVGAYAVEDRFFPEQTVLPIEINSYILQAEIDITDLDTESCSGDD